MIQVHRREVAHNVDVKLHGYLSGSCTLPTGSIPTGSIPDTIELDQKTQNASFGE